MITFGRAKTYYKTLILKDRFLRPPEYTHKAHTKRISKQGKVFSTRIKCNSENSREKLYKKINKSPIKQRSEKSILRN